MVVAKILVVLCCVHFILGSPSIVQDENDGKIKRQTANATQTVPPKRRPSNIFSLLSVLLRETRDDARKALSDIRKMFNSQFAAPTTNVVSTSPKPDNDTMTTTTEFKISRDEFNGIVSSNVRGLFNLLGQEWRNALRDSNKNVREFGRDFRKALRPYVT